MQEAASEPHLVDELVEGVLAVGARLAKVDLACHRGEEGNTLRRGIGRDAAAWALSGCLTRSCTRQPPEQQRRLLQKTAIARTRFVGQAGAVDGHALAIGLHGQLLDVGSKVLRTRRGQGGGSAR